MSRPEPGRSFISKPRAGCLRSNLYLDGDLEGGGVLLHRQRVRSLTSMRRRRSACYARVFHEMPHVAVPLAPSTLDHRSLACKKAFITRCSRSDPVGGSDLCRNKVGSIEETAFALPARARAAFPPHERCGRCLGDVQ